MVIGPAPVSERVRNAACVLDLDRDPPELVVAMYSCDCLGCCSYVRKFHIMYSTTRYSAAALSNCYVRT